MIGSILHIDGVPVDREVAPESEAELALAMKEAGTAGWTMVAVGGGTQLDLGNPPRSVNLAVHTRRMKGIVEYEPGNLTVSVRAGTRLGDLQQILRAENQFLPLDPPRPEAATLGGLVAGNASGPIRFRFGTVRDMLIGIRMTHADGMRSMAGGKLVKNVSGYDMCKLYAGSLGTLGFCSELTLKVQPIPEAIATLTLGYPSLSDALETVQSLLRADLDPDAMEVVNSTAWAALDGESGTAPWILLIRFGDMDAAVRWQMDRARDLVAASRAKVIRVLGKAESEEFWLRMAGQRAGPIDGAVLLLKCAVLSQAAAASVHLMEELGKRLHAATFLYGHAGTHVFHGRYEWPESTIPAEAVQSAIHELRRHCLAVGGHLVVERAWLEVKKGLDVWGYQAPALELMRRIKMQFDPKGLLNPGRFVGGI